jgi:hypothetical protein
METFCDRIAYRQQVVGSFERSVDSVSRAFVELGRGCARSESEA